MKKLREMKRFSQEKRMLQGDLTVVFQYLKWSYKEDGDRHFKLKP